MSLGLAAGGGRYSFLNRWQRLEDCGLELWNAATRKPPLFLRAPYLTALEMGMPDSFGGALRRAEHGRAPLR